MKKKKIQERMMDKPIHKCFNFRILSIEPCHKKFLFFITILLVLFYTITGEKSFDYLILSQRWIPTSCVDFEEKPHSNNSCTLPENYNFWAIHGLWPTRQGEMGPFFCNKSMKFDVQALEPIRKELEIWWPNIESTKNVASLWKHEWTKHGTCAAQLEAFDKEVKYFNKTLEFFKQYKVENLLKTHSFVESDTNGYSVVDIFVLIKNTLGKNPYITCITERISKKPFLAEIRVCLDKKLNLMDCEEVTKPRRFSGDIFYNAVTNCPFEKKVFIPKTVTPYPSKKSFDRSRQTYKTLYEVLNIIKFLQWSFL